MSKYKVKDLPAVFMIKAAEQKPIKYEGKGFTY